MAWVARSAAALVTLALLGGLVLWGSRVSLKTARRIWLVVFTVVVGGGITMMDAHAFVAKWAFKGDSPRDGLIALMDGTAHRPFVYRRLAPDLVRVGTSLVLAHAPGTAARLVSDSPLKRYRLTWIDDTDWSPRKAVAFHVAYALVWLSLFAALLSGAWLVHVVTRSSAFESIVASSLGMSLLPLMFVGGGYLYDAPELFFWTTILAVAIAGPLALVVPLFALMLYNKESALLAVPALFPLIHARAGRARALGWTAALGLLGCGWVSFVRHRFAALPGVSTEWWLPLNLGFWGNPKNYFLFAQLHSPALVSPRGANLLSLVLVLVPVRFGWPAVGRELRWATILTALALAPFFIAFGYMDELRGLLLVFPPLFAIAVRGVRAMFRAEAP